MSFSFKWPRFSDQFHADAIQMLDAALNKGNKPPVIADKIEVVELEMGTQVMPLAQRLSTQQSALTISQSHPSSRFAILGNSRWISFEGYFV